MMPGCFFPEEGVPIQISVYRDGAAERPLSVSLYYDMEKIRSQNGGEPAGLVVYSLGFSACTPSAQSFGRMLAERGYVVAIPGHTDFYAVCVCVPDNTGASGGADSGQLVNNPALSQFSSLSREKAISEDQLEEIFYYRNADLHATIENMTTSENYEFGSLKGKPVFLAGYSLGGWNALNVAGAAKLFPELQCNVTAVICQNAFVGKLTEDQIRRISCPVLYLAGTEDSLHPRIRLLYDWRPDNSRMVEIVGADHYLFASDLCSSPILSAVHPGSCDEDTIEIARRVNELTVDFICHITATNKVPKIENLDSYSSDIFTVLP